VEVRRLCCDGNVAATITCGSCKKHMQDVLNSVLHDTAVMSMQDICNFNRKYGYMEFQIEDLMKY